MVDGLEEWWMGWRSGGWVGRVMDELGGWWMGWEGGGWVEGVVDGLGEWWMGWGVVDGLEERWMGWRGGLEEWWMGWKGGGGVGGSWRDGSVDSLDFQYCFLWRNNLYIHKDPPLMLLGRPRNAQ